MAVRIGSARIDENGNAYGGVAGDQTGKEVSTQNWYLHSKGWVLLRAKSSVVAEKIAKCMEYACANSHVGYDQWNRNSLFSAAAPYDYDVSKVTKDVETDCSALVRVCCAYAGIVISTAFRTTTQASVMSATGAFDKITDTKYTTKSTYLKRGDVLITKTQGHTVVVLTDGPKAEYEDTSTSVDSDTNPYTEPTTTIKKGSTNEEGVKWVQWYLNDYDYDLGSYGIDGDFGSKTFAAVKEFQNDRGLDVDGIVDSETRAALKISPADATSTTNPYSEPTTLIKQGSSNDEAVKWIQWELHRLNYDLGDDGIDGDFGAKTLSAVKKFQSDANIEVDGIVGSETRKALKAA